MTSFYNWLLNEASMKNRTSLGKHIQSFIINGGKNNLETRLLVFCDYLQESDNKIEQELGETLRDFIQSYVQTGDVGEDEEGKPFIEVNKNLRYIKKLIEEEGYDINNDYFNSTYKGKIVQGINYKPLDRIIYDVYNHTVTLLQDLGNRTKYNRVLITDIDDVNIQRIWLYFYILNLIPDLRNYGGPGDAPDLKFTHYVTRKELGHKDYETQRRLQFKTVYDLLKWNSHYVFIAKNLMKLLASIRAEVRDNPSAWEKEKANLEALIKYMKNLTHYDNTTINNIINMLEKELPNNIDGLSVVINYCNNLSKNPMYSDETPY